GAGPRRRRVGRGRLRARVPAGPELAADRLLAAGAGVRPAGGAGGAGRRRVGAGRRPTPVAVADRGRRRLVLGLPDPRSGDGGGRGADRRAGPHAAAAPRLDRPDAGGRRGPRAAALPVRRAAAVEPGEEAAEGGPAGRRPGAAPPGGVSQSISP